MYEMYELKYRKFTRGLFYYGCAAMLPYFNPLVVAIVDICSGNFDSSAFNLPLNVVVPFNTEVAAGWLVFWYFQFNLALTYELAMSLATTHLVGFCYYIMATCNHFGLLIDSIRIDCERTQWERNTEVKLYLWFDATKKLQQIVELHVNIYEWEQSHFSSKSNEKLLQHYIAF